MRIRQPTPAEEAQWKEWLASRPESIRRVAEQFDPLSLYRIKSTGHRVTLYSFHEGDPVTLVVNVLAKYNFVAFERRVFGVPPEDLEPCDLPGPDEHVGALAKTDAEIEAVVNIIKAHRD